MHDVFGNCVGDRPFAGRTQELRFESTDPARPSAVSTRSISDMEEYAETYPLHLRRRRNAGSAALDRAS